jgi:hypothetical protein
MDSVLPMIPAGQIPIDTMPPNYRLIGFIRMALPDARVIQTRRDRVDLAIALFQKRFPALWYGYTYNLPELGQHLRAYDRLMSWWHQAFPGFIFDADVSKLGTEASMWELLAFCGLEWDSACLAPHESEPRLGDDPIRAAARRERRHTFYEPLLRPYLAGSEGAAAPG